MSDFNGKYEKSRTCKHAVAVRMVLVDTDQECPKAIKFSLGPEVSKTSCDTCEAWETKEEITK